MFREYEESLFNVITRNKVSVNYIKDVSEVGILLLLRAVYIFILARL